MKEVKKVNKVIKELPKKKVKKLIKKIEEPITIESISRQLFKDTYMPHFKTMADCEKHMFGLLQRITKFKMIIGEEQDRVDSYKLKLEKSLKWQKEAKEVIKDLQEITNSKNDDLIRTHISIYEKDLLLEAKISRELEL